MSRSPLILLSLVLPAVLGAVTVVGVMTLSDAPANSVGRPVEVTQDPRARQEEDMESPTSNGHDTSQAPASRNEKATPATKPRAKKPREVSGPVLYAARARELERFC